MISGVLLFKSLEIKLCSDKIWYAWKHNSNVFLLVSETKNTWRHFNGGLIVEINKIERRKLNSVWCKREKRNSMTFSLKKWEDKV